jgi:2-methylcitrate dehydratase PrpD
LSLPTRIIPPARVEVTTRDGRTLSSQVVDAKGHPNNPMTWDELKEKFRDCTTHSAAPLDKTNVERAVMMCFELEKASDVSQLARLLCAA